MEIQVETKQRIEDIRENIFDNYRAIDETFDLVLSCKDMQSVIFIQETACINFPYYYFMAIVDIEKLKLEDYPVMEQFLCSATSGHIEQLELKADLASNISPLALLNGFASAIKNTNEEVHLDGFILNESWVERIFRSAVGTNTLKIMNWKFDFSAEIENGNQRENEKSIEETKEENKLEIIFFSGSLPSGIKEIEGEIVGDWIEEIQRKSWRDLCQIIQILKKFGIEKSLKEVKIEETDIKEGIINKEFKNSGFSVEIEHW